MTEHRKPYMDPKLIFQPVAKSDRRRIRINKRIQRLNTTSAITIGEGYGYGEEPLTAMQVAIDQANRKISVRMTRDTDPSGFPLQDGRFIRLPREFFEALKVDMEEFEITMTEGDEGWWDGNLDTAHAFRRSNKKP